MSQAGFATIKCSCFRLIVQPIYIITIIIIIIIITNIIIIIIRALTTIGSQIRMLSIRRMPADSPLFGKICSNDLKTSAVLPYKDRNSPQAQPVSTGISNRAPTR